MPITLDKAIEDVRGDLLGFITKLGMVDADLLGPIRDAVPTAGGVLADPTEVTDGDVATVTSYQRFIILARINVVKRMWGRWAEVDQKDGDVEQKLNQLGDRLEKKAKALLEELKDPELAATLIVETPPVIGTIKAGETTPIYPFNPYL